MKSPPSAPEIDYLSKDYNSFRRLLLDQLALRVPDWPERNPSDLGVVLVELLAYAADQLSYYQDAVATETYLRTSRRASSVRRHARLLDYAAHNGCNSRVWVHFQVRRKVEIPTGLQLVTRFRDPTDSPMIARATPAYVQAMESGPVFETLHAARMQPVCNEFHLVAQNDLLPAGATSAVLVVPDAATLAGPTSTDKPQPCDVGEEPWTELLRPGDVLVLEEVRNPQTGLPSQADPSHRHAVRITKVRVHNQRSRGQRASICRLVVEWSAADALPFDLATTRFGARAEHPASVARGNIVLADYGRTRAVEPLPPVRPGQRYRPYLRHPDVTHAVPYRHAVAVGQPASQSIVQDPGEALAAVELCQRLGAVQYRWQVRPGLLGSGDQSRDFVVESMAGGMSFLRFGFDGIGVTPSPADEFETVYRTGQGPKGNVGAEAIGFWIEDTAQRIDPTSIERVYNPLPGQGGVDAEEREQVRTLAPHAFRRPLRCVTADDYAAWTSRHPDVAEARATLERTGRGPLVVIHARRVNDRVFDDAFRRELLDLLELARQIGHDISLHPPCYVRPRISIRLRVAANRFRAEVREAAVTALGLATTATEPRTNRPGAAPAFFAPQQLGFGRTLYRSQLMAHLLSVAGVEQVTVECFERRGAPTPGGERIELRVNEILRLIQNHDDPDLQLEVEGGK